MTTAIERVAGRFLRSLRDLEAGINNQSFRDEIRAEWPDLLKEAQATISRVQSEIETDIAHTREDAAELISVANNLRNAMTVIGSDGSNLALLQATDKKNLDVFMKYVLHYPEIMQRVLAELPEDEWAAFLGMVQGVRR